MTLWKKVLVILSPVMVIIFLRLVSEVVSIETESVFRIPFLVSLAFVLHCVFPFMILRYFGEIRYARLMAVLLIVVIGFGTMIDMLIMYEIRYFATMAPHFKPAHEIVVQSLPWVVNLSHLVSIIVGIVAVVTVVKFEDFPSKIVLLMISVLFLLVHVVHLFGSPSVLGSGIYELIYTQSRNFNIVIGSVVLLCGFRELDAIKRPSVTYEYS